VEFLKCLPAMFAEPFSISGFPGNDFGKDVAMGLKERRIETKVSSRLGSLRIELNGRTTVDYRYHLDEGKVV
jgi:hypothetical protein